jgi:hypothetical protein
MHNNFKKIIYLAGHFGIIIREHAEKLVYTGTYGHISANNTFAKLEREYGLLKRIDRGKRKTDGYRLTNDGVKQFKSLFGYEPKVYSSGDKLSHSIQILNFYSEVYNDAVKRDLISDHNIIEEKRIIHFNVQREISFYHKGKEQVMIPDGFCIYRYAQTKGTVFYLEIENSDQKASLVANKTVSNYEGYFLSGKWKTESWQPKEIKLFPPILIVTYSEFKQKEFIRWFNTKVSGDIKYYFTNYNELQKNGFSGNIWQTLDGQVRRIVNV